MAVLATLTPQRGQTLADGTPNPIRNAEETLFLQVERTRDEVSGKHPIRYYEAYVIDHTVIPACTATGGAGGGAGTEVVTPQLPKNTKILSVLLDVTEAFTTSAGTAADIDDITLGASTSLVADAGVAASIAVTGMIPFTLGAGTPNTVTGVLPIKLSAPAAITVHLAGDDTRTYTAGHAILVEVLSYFDE